MFSVFWSLFFTRELVELIVLYTNFKGRAREPVPSLSRMALALLKDIEQYQSRTRGTFEFIVEAMSCNRFQDIARAFSVSDPRLQLSEFDRVSNAFLTIYKAIY